MVFLNPISEKKLNNSGSSSTAVINQHDEKKDKEKNIKLITPSPKFVIKTKIFSQFEIYQPGTKLFINICTHNIVPKPEIPKFLPKNNKKILEIDSNNSTNTTDDNDNDDNDDDFFDPKLIFSLIMENQWEIPILTSPNIRQETDKKGNKSLAIDCIINEQPMRWCMINEDLKSILIEWCFDAVEFRINSSNSGNSTGSFKTLVIDRESVSLPKRSYLGKLTDLEIDINEIKNNGKDLKELRDKLENNETLGLLEAKRSLNGDYDDNDNDTDDFQGIKNKKIELTSIFDEFGLNDTPRPKNGNKVLIEEISASQDSKTTKNNSMSSNTPITTPPATKVTNNKQEPIKFDINVTRLDENKDNYKLLIKIKNEILINLSDYYILFNKDFENNNELIISTMNLKFRSISKVNFPLPNNLIGETCLKFNDFEKQVYCYIK
ncbi:hypothetical protein B5S30_g4324 [[Candida] boidinii]|nr:hypothetical protein B5S30_g4324 [[Candida] boidinii]GMF99546.1 unnamed protein product [[Candida] boidinii]